MLIVSKQLTVSGFIVSNIAAKYKSDFEATIEPLVAKGEIKYKEDSTKGIENVGEAILAVQTGKNNGKSVVIVSE